MNTINARNLALTIVFLLSILIFGGSSATTIATNETISQSVTNQDSDPDSQTEPPQSFYLNEVDHYVFLPLARKPYTPIIPDILQPFDASQINTYGPRNFWSNWGRWPEIAISSTGEAIDVLAQDYSTTTHWNAVLLRIAKQDGRYIVKQALTGLPMLDRIMDVATDTEGNRYYATAVDERALITPDYPPLDTYRSDIVRIFKVSPSGDVLYDIDLDIARHAFFEWAEMIINPMFFGTARLEVGGG